MKQRVKQTICLKDRLASFAREIREKASHLPPGAEREAMLKRASRADTAADLDDWVNSAGLQPPSKVASGEQLRCPDVACWLTNGPTLPQPSLIWPTDESVRLTTQ